MPETKTKKYSVRENRLLGLNKAPAGGSKDIDGNIGKGLVGLAKLDPREAAHGILGGKPSVPDKLIAESDQYESSMSLLRNYGNMWRSKIKKLFVDLPKGVFDYFITDPVRYLREKVKKAGKFAGTVAKETAEIPVETVATPAKIVSNTAFNTSRLLPFGVGTLPALAVYGATKPFKSVQAGIKSIHAKVKKQLDRIPGLGGGKDKKGPDLVEVDA